MVYPRYTALIVPVSYNGADGAGLPFDEEPGQVENHEHNVVVQQGRVHLKHGKVRTVSRENVNLEMYTCR